MTVVEHAANPPVAGGLVAGIDTHKHTHHVAVLDHLGRSIADRQFATTSAGYDRLVEFLQHHQPIDRVGVEGTGSYGAGVARVLSAQGSRSSK
jgi:transposase